MIAGIAIPDFWLGIMLVLLFAGTCGAAAVGLRAVPARTRSQNLRYMVLPVVTLAFGEAAYILRTTRGAMEATLGTPFVAVPRARGRRERDRLPARAAQRRRPDRHGRRASSSACCSAARS